MSSQKRPLLLAAAVFAGAIGLLVPLTLYAEAGTAERVKTVAVKAKKALRTKKQKAASAQQAEAQEAKEAKEQAPVKTLVVKRDEEPVKPKAKAKAKKFL